MASLSPTKRPGCWLIQFKSFTDRLSRVTIHLGKMSRKDAERYRSHIDNLITHKLARTTLQRETASFIAEVGDAIHAKLAKADLVEPRERKAVPVTLGAYLDNYISKRTDLKERSASNLKQVRTWITKHFSEQKDLRSITPGDAADWQRFVKGKLSGATASAHVIKARQMFQDAVDRRIIAENPFKKLKAGGQTNAARLEYVSVADTLKAIEACPDAEWRLIFALARFGGLRIPSESSRLRWSDIDWSESRMTVHSPKTEHHEGKDKREVPIVPSLMTYLREAHDQMEVGEARVIARHRGENLRTRAEKIIDKAGLARWGKQFQNLRSSCETDLCEKFPLHVVCAWIGNSPNVARRHYLQITDEHFARAAKSAADTSGQDRTKAGSANEKAQVSQQSEETQYPRQGSKLSRDTVENLRQSERALQTALHSVENSLSRRRKRDLAHIAHRINLVRRRVTPSHPPAPVSPAANLRPPPAKRPSDFGGGR